VNWGGKVVFSRLYYRCFCVLLELNSKRMNVVSAVVFDEISM
jgi:hypothetical protein